MKPKPKAQSFKVWAEYDKELKYFTGNTLKYKALSTHKWTVWKPVTMTFKPRRK